MNQPDPSEYEIQDPKGVRPQDPSTIEDPYSIEDARMDRSKPGSWSTRAMAVILTALVFNEDVVKNESNDLIALPLPQLVLVLVLVETFFHDQDGSIRP